MHISKYEYQLPDQAISREPAEPRDSARLLVSRYVDERIDTTVSELSSILDNGDVLVVNNTKVLPARIPVTRSTGGKAEIFLLHRIGENVWNALVKPSRKVDIGDTVYIDAGQSYSIKVDEDLGEGHRVVTFLDADDHEVLKQVGKAPLPPYLGNVDVPLERYQTMFAQDDRSVAAPTAGLHFTDNVVKSLQKKNINVLEVTLHVGVGTFRPILTEEIEDHIMHEEMYSVERDVWDTIMYAKKHGRRIVAVGTTTLRTLESVALTGKLEGATDLYCYGNFHFRIADYLFTNFHQPGSSLLVLLDSFMGSRWRELYDYALENQYRFLSFGDAMLVGLKER